MYTGNLELISLDFYNFDLEVKQMRHFFQEEDEGMRGWVPPELQYLLNRKQYFLLLKKNEKKNVQIPLSVSKRSFSFNLNGFKEAKTKSFFYHKICNFFPDLVPLYKNYIFSSSYHPFTLIFL